LSLKLAQLDSTDRALEPYQQGQYSEAAKLAEESLKFAKKTFGDDHSNVATSLNHLAMVYREQGKYAEAEPLLKRALEIFEKAQGPDHPTVAASLESYSLLLRKTGCDAEAARMEARAKAIRAIAR
jgi:tetratricopeptide (TPR) repeat protein